MLDNSIPLEYTVNMTKKQLQAWRKKNGYSQSQLARVLLVTPLTVSRWERGERHIPSFLRLTLECVEKKGGELKLKGTKRKGGKSLKNIKMTDLRLRWLMRETNTSCSPEGWSRK